MAWEGVNKRRFPRVNYPCVIRLRRKDNPEVFEVKTENIGCGGICVILSKDVGMFAPVELEIDLSNGEPTISCEGIVVWVVRKIPINKNIPHSFDTGIEFTNLKKEDEVRIENIINLCLQKEKS